MKTVLECLESGAAYLRDHEVESPRRNMEWMVAHLLGSSRIEHSNAETLSRWALRPGPVPPTLPTGVVFRQYAHIRGRYGKDG